MGVIQSMGKMMKGRKMTLVNAGVGAYFANDTYQQSRADGSSKAGAMAAAAADFALPMMMSGPGYLALQAVQAVPEAVIGGYEAAESYRRKLRREGRNSAFQNAQFNDTEQIHTMRQAGMAIAQRSKYNVQQARLGSEAKYMMK